MNELEPTWIFGYGSLIFRPAFRSERTAPGLIRGFVRRFWQASTDHRGTPQAPGRVVTLVPMPTGLCAGVAYRLFPKDVASILARLDVREQGGYHQLTVDVELDDDSVVSAITYYADRNNDNYVGETPVEEIAQVTRTAVGPSGANRDYVLRLADELRQMGVDDAHVFELEALVKQ